jgi:RHS repeat-associated protein
VKNTLKRDKTLVEKTHFSHWVGMRNISDYSPFGVLLPERTSSTAFYRLGFQGQEHDDEVKGEGNSYKTEFRQYDPRIVKWLSLDPLAAKYPSMSPYIAYGNNPILFIDSDGDSLKLHGTKAEQKSTLAQLQKLTNDELRLQNGKVLIKSHRTANTEKKLTTGTDLIEELIVHKNTVIIIQNEINKSSATGEFHPGTETLDNENRYNGVGKNAYVYVDFSMPSYLLTENKESGNTEEWYTPEHITLSHELIHALNILKGTALKTGVGGVYDSYTYKTESGQQETIVQPKEETDTVGLTGNRRYTENKIRKEQGNRKRVKY